MLLYRVVHGSSMHLMCFSESVYSYVRICMLSAISLLYSLVVDILISLFNNASNINLGENDTEVTFLVSKEGEAVRDVRVMVLTLPLTATGRWIGS